VRVKRTAGQNRRSSRASVKLVGKFRPRSPANRLQSETDMRKTSSVGSTKKIATKAAVGAA